MGLVAELSLLRQTPSCVPQAVPHEGHLACSQAHFALPRAATPLAELHADKAPKEAWRVPHRQGGMPAGGWGAVRKPRAQCRAQSRLRSRVRRLRPTGRKQPQERLCWKPPLKRPVSSEPHGHLVSGPGRAGNTLSTPQLPSPRLVSTSPGPLTEARPGARLPPPVLTGLEDPLQVPIELSLDLLLPAKLQEGPAVLDPLTLLGKLSALRRPRKGRVSVSTATSPRACGHRGRGNREDAGT